MERETKSWVFEPYLEGKGPVFTLTLWDTGRCGDNGADLGIRNKQIAGYRLKQDDVVLFEGEDFYCSPMYTPCSDDAAEEVMGFLTLRPEDVEDEYFEKYTPAQLEYCRKYAEMLDVEVCDRFGRFEEED